MKYLLDSDVVNILYDDSRKEHHEALLRNRAYLWRVKSPAQKSQKPESERDEKT